MTYFSAGEAANRICARLLRGLGMLVTLGFGPSVKAFLQNLC